MKWTGNDKIFYYVPLHFPLILFQKMTNSFQTLILRYLAKQILGEK